MLSKLLSNHWLTTISWVEVGVIGLALILVVRKPKLWAQWPSCCLYVLVEFSRDIILMGWLYHTAHNRASWYIYWLSQGMLSMLKLLVIVDVLRSFPGLSFLPRKLYLLIGVMGATIILCSVGYCYLTEISPCMQVKQSIVLINQAVRIGWGAFAVTLLAAIRLFNFGWEPRGAGIALCLFTRICTDLVVSMMYGASRNTRLAGMFLDTFCTICLYLSWSCLLVRPPKYHDRVLDEGDAETINNDVKNLLTALSFQQRKIRAGR